MQDLYQFAHISAYHNYRKRVVLEYPISNVLPIVFVGYYMNKRSINEWRIIVAWAGHPLILCQDLFSHSPKHLF